jgi:hypothetical protein
MTSNAGDSSNTAVLKRIVGLRCSEPRRSPSVEAGVRPTVVAGPDEDDEIIRNIEHKVKYIKQVVQSIAVIRFVD